MYNSQYYTCEQIDQRLLQNYLDDYNSQNSVSLTKAQFLTKLYNALENYEDESEVIDLIEDYLGNGFLYAGLATPTGTPTLPQDHQAQLVFIAINPGTYTNYGNINITNVGLHLILWDTDTWSYDTVLEIDQQTGQSTTKTMSQKTITDLLSLVSDSNIKANIGYYECDTAAGTAAKAITVANYALFVGGSMKVKFANKNTANNATLNINSQGAKALYYQGERASASNTWEAGETLEVYYDGTSFYANSVAGGSGSGDGAFDISAKTGNTYETLSAALTAANSILSASKKKGGMSIKFILRTNTGTEEVPVYNDKYVQYRLMATTWSTVITDWSFCGDNVLIDNPEWIYVLLDAKKRILAGLKSDGSVEWSIGVPTPVKTYVDNVIAEINEIKNGTEGIAIDGLNKIIGFLSDFSTSDTLKNLLDIKVNKEEGKSLIDSEYAEGISFVENPEFAAVYLDHDDKILFGVKANSDFYFGYGVPTQIVDYVNSKKAEILAVVQAETTRATAVEDTKVDKVTGKGLIQNDVAESLSAIEDPEGRSEITTDSEGKIISYRRPNGTVVENAGVETKSIESESYNFSDKNAQEIKDALNRIGFTTKTPNDHSNQDSIQIPEPHLAVINITNDKGEAFWPTTKTTDAKYWMEFYDGNGNYFKKRIIFNAQGNSSLFFDKKNGSIDICNDEWEGDDTCNIRFGKWTACDSFHLKSYYFDLFKGNGVIAYKIANQIMESRDFNENRPWKKELISADDKDATKVGNPSYSSLDDISLQIDNGARCVPDGFPAIVFLNSEFYGIYAFTYKKHRSNYNMDKATPEHIHLDGGELTSRTIFGGTVSWADFEIRNPKYLVYMTPRNTSFDPTNAKQVKKAYQYDADVAQAEIAGTDSPLTFDVATTYTLGQIVLYNNRQYMAMRETTGNTPTQNNKPKNVYDNAAANGYWIDITYTNKVKQYILDLSNRMSQITSAVNPKEELQKYFDLDNIVDYELYVTLTHNIDAQGFNWQLCSWNGERWYFCVWDAERIWGQVNTFNYLDSVPLEGTLLYGSSAGTPNAWVNDNCKSELKQRWIELVSQKIADKDHIICMIKDWMDRIGPYFYEKEYEKWPLSPCNRDSKFNKTSWKLIGQHSFELPEWNQERTYYEGNKTREGINIYKALSTNTNKKPSDNPLVWELLSYKEGVQYNIGDRLIVGSDFTYEVECIESTSESPLLGSYSGYPADLGYHDNIWRLYDYISKWIDNLSIYFNSLNV